MWDGNATGVYTYNKGDGGVNGTGRSDKTVQYRNSFGNLHVAIQAQLKTDDFMYDIVDVSRSVLAKHFGMKVLIVLHKE